MIRKATPEEFGVLGNIWLKASIKAHHFVPREFWEGNLAAMCDEYLPASETWVVENEGEVAGFMSLMGETVAALFVMTDKQGRGLGSSLLKHAKEAHESLNLCVYKENDLSVLFYKKNGFKVVEEGKDDFTGRPEFVMHWQR
ncbi:N-acetyltransferase [Maridesulfovibrio sp.]|uniref:N-acetyltransferase n=1 Tax=Maridesulfovibrio sp. TaxID=2795000 RepID=UPI0029F459CD|nr:N-acetyltransferase [Maridesulfovibrio sp.]